MRFMYDKCDIFAIGVEFTTNRSSFGEYFVGIRIGWRCIGVVWG